LETVGIIFLAILLLWIYSEMRDARAAPSVQGGYSSRKVALGEILPPELAELEMEDHYIVRVAGVSHQNDDGTSRQEILARCKVPGVLELRRQPNHRHDRNAVQVLRQNGEMLGFIPRGDASVMAPELDKGRRNVALLTTVDGGSGRERFLGAGVLIVKVNEDASA
jgi:HIRAN domain